MYCIDLTSYKSRVIVSSRRAISLDFPLVIRLTDLRWWLSNPWHMKPKSTGILQVFHPFQLTSIFPLALLDCLPRILATWKSVKPQVKKVLVIILIRVPISERLRGLSPCLPYFIRILLCGPHMCHPFVISLLGILHMLTNKVFCKLQNEGHGCCLATKDQEQRINKKAAREGTGFVERHGWTI